MHFTKTTTRAFAVSFALVASGAAVAGAAVFHLPILGFGASSVASADSGHTARPTSVVHHKVQPRKIVKTRVVTDIVHVPAPVARYSASSSHAAYTVSAPSYAPPAPAPTVAPAPVPAVRAAPVTTTTPSSVASPYGGGPELEHETHGTAPAHQSQTDGAAPSTAGDQ